MNDYEKHLKAQARRVARGVTRLVTKDEIVAGMIQYSPPLEIAGVEETGRPNTFYVVYVGGMKMTHSEGYPVEVRV